MTQTKIQQFIPQIFTVWSDEIIKNRIDAYFYQSQFKELYKVLRKGTFKISRLSDLFDGELIKGILPTHEEKKGDINVVQISNISRDGTINAIDCITAKHKIYTERHILEKNDILIVITGATIGKIGFWQKEKSNYYLGGDIIKFHVKKGFNPVFVWAYLMSGFGQKQILRHITGATNKHLSPNDIANIQIPLLPINKQNRVSVIIQKAYREKKQKEARANELLSSIDDYILSKLGIKFPEIKKEMVFEVMSDKVKNNRVDARYWQPFLEKVKHIINKGKYKTQKLENFITKIHYGASTSNAYVDNGIPLLRILNLKSNYIDLLNVAHLPENFRKELGNAFVKNGDLLISRSGTVGVVSVVPKEVDGFAFGSFMIKFCLNDKINKEFVSIWLNNKLNKLLTEREKIGAIQGNITIGTIKDFDIPVPPLAIQDKIVKKIKFYYSQAQKLKDEASNGLQEARDKVEGIILG